MMLKKQVRKTVAIFWGKLWKKKNFCDIIIPEVSCVYLSTVGEWWYYVHTWYVSSLCNRSQVISQQKWNWQFRSMGTSWVILTGVLSHFLHIFSQLSGPSEWGLQKRPTTPVASMEGLTAHQLFSVRNIKSFSEKLVQKPVFGTQVLWEWLLDLTWHPELYLSFNFVAMSLISVSLL